MDAVKETATIPESNIAPPPNAKLSHHNMYIRNIGTVGDGGDGIRLLLDLEKFLTQD